MKDNEETRKKYRDFNVTEDDFAYYRYLNLLQSAEAALTVSRSLKQQKKDIEANEPRKEYRDLNVAKEGFVNLPFLSFCKLHCKVIIIAQV